jgi:hypothetical protein
MKLRRIHLHTFDKTRMSLWREKNGIPQYINASYVGATGCKDVPFPTSGGIKVLDYPDITDSTLFYEEEILQKLKDLRKKPFGYLRALWHMSQHFSTGEPWDSKFMPQFPGRDISGRVQYAKYNNEIISGNDLSNIIYGHVCAYMKLPLFLAKFVGRLDACGVIEIITKKKFPNIKLLKFRDPASDQEAIVRGYREFDPSNYRLTDKMF